MDRRKFFKIGSIASVGTALVHPISSLASTPSDIPTYKGKTPKNIIMLVADGMSNGTLTMSDVYMKQKYGFHNNWISLYQDNKVSRALMDMASASSIVTDSAAASSSWGGGVRVNNGSLNVAPNGEPVLPIWQKFKNAGKMAGCVTTVAVTHATPAGFCVSSKRRNAQDDIAQEYLRLGFDVLMGGGNNNFDSTKRKDGEDMYAQYREKGYQIARTKAELHQLNNNKPILGVFADDAFPYALDRDQDEKIRTTLPTLAEMASKAIDAMRNHKKGFVLQIESGKVDWAAHANDIGALLHEQLALDATIKVVMDFAEKDKETLVIITTDHGNANPGLLYGKDATKNFDSVQRYKLTNEAILNSFSNQSSIKQVVEMIDYANGFKMENSDAQRILDYYHNLERSEEGLYNYKKLPYKLLSEIQQKTNSVGWISMDHTGDYVELAMFGPGSERLKPFMKNTDLHYFILEVAEVEVK